GASCAEPGRERDRSGLGSRGGRALPLGNGARPAPGAGGEEAAWEPLLHPAAGGPPGAPPSGGPPHCGAPAPASPRLAPQAGSSPPPEAAREHPGLAWTPSPSLSLSCGQPAPGSGAGAAECCWVPAEAGSGGEEECPICTEPYDGGPHKPVPLNCGHVLCRHCLRAIMDAAGEAEMGRVRCPICRQKTPMLEWEICKLQEELLLLHQEPAPASLLVLPMAPVLPPRRPGLCGALEHHFQVRFHTSRTFRMFGCLPCVRYPLCLVSGLGRLERRCRCCYLLSLAALLAAETVSLLLIFLPIVLLVLLFLILDK
ncbi:ring finger protein-like, partial [Emydura macquarii macquarii]|uniref:ring finger protein-like n=1 Tax=Emydura macquarii macquarii TaxID=1129001 RepID=UPI00352AEF5F